MAAPATSVAPSTSAALIAALKAWWEEESTDWDAAVMGTDISALPGGSDLWDDMPTVDSKAIARSSPIFERHLGIPLDVRQIRRGGYDSIDDAAADLVSKMEAIALKKNAKKDKGE